MTLKIKVISYRGQSPAENLEASFDQDGGTIGRSLEKRKNHLALHDPEKFISRRHATIKFEKGLYYLSDTSVDGTNILNKNIRVCRDTVPLTDGDRLKIGHYELIVCMPSTDALATVGHSSAYSNKESELFSDFDRGKITFGISFGKQPSFTENSFLQPERDVFAETPGKKHFPGQTEDSPLHDLFALPDLAEEVGNSRGIPKDFNFEELIKDIDKNSGTHVIAQPVVVPTADGHSNLQAKGKVLKESHFIGRPDLSGANRNLQQNATLMEDHSTEKSIPTNPVTIQQIRQQAHLELFKIFLESAGVKDTNFLHDEDIEGLMQTVGAVFREMIDGLMAILRGREELKTQFRVSATILKSTDNNPLKFSRIVEDSLKQLLTKNKPEFVDAMDAVREGFTDIKNHQLAMTAGIQAAIINLLGRFDPQHFAKQYEEGVVFQRKAKSWDAYQQSYTEIANEALEDFFGESFIRAYEEQIRKLL